ncbi:MBL fold metallo-hydrolase [Bacillus sp. es.036]|uniref:MBL fold metallo-hydrolase n=1 Tax=Bacillus sp. es.036 TaxID=1761764 RepID=UPI000BF63361|nr:MBL fold metallo-hydrolase [Bacillus sp. es.036]PFG12434.1 glyoxylase-like metal-dependent hydrolase (beta-lactamase superfamily II) [Bacillus sp. es.036]
MQQIKQIGDRFYYQTPVSETDRPILGMVVGDEKSLMIDAGNSEAHARYFLEELSDRGLKRPDMVALTHWHWDHIFGLSALRDTVSISSFQTKEEMAKLIPLSWSDADLDQRVEEGTEIEFCATAIKKEFVNHRHITITLPDLTFEDKLEIDLGGVTCVLQHVGGDHAADSVVVYIKEEKILFLGDCFYPDIFSSKTNYTVRTTNQLLDVLEGFEGEWVILSHGEAIPIEEFKKEVKLLRTVSSITEACRGNQQEMQRSFKGIVGRELNEEEREVIQEFANGYSL